MTKVFIKKSNGNILQYKVTGHSGFAEEGSDIVCVSVSTLAQSTILGISEVLGIKCNQKIDEKLPSLEFKFASSAGLEDIQKAQVLLSTFEVAVKNIAKQYKKYVSVEVEDVND